MKWSRYQEGRKSRAPSYCCCCCINTNTILYNPSLCPVCRFEMQEKKDMAKPASPGLSMQDTVMQGNIKSSSLLLLAGKGCLGHGGRSLGGRRRGRVVGAIGEQAKCIRMGDCGRWCASARRSTRILTGASKATTWYQATTAVATRAEHRRRTEGGICAWGASGRALEATQVVGPDLVLEGLVVRGEVPCISATCLRATAGATPLVAAGTLGSLLGSSSLSLERELA